MTRNNQRDMHSRDEFNKRIVEAVQHSAWIDPAKLSPAVEPPEELPSMIENSALAPSVIPDADSPRADGIEHHVLDAQTNGLDLAASDHEPDKPRVGGKSDKLDSYPERERPRERMHELGPAGITTTELLAIVLGSGIQGRNVKFVADDLLNEFDGLNGLSRVSAFNMQGVGGIGRIKADMLTAAFELGRRAAQEQFESVEGGYGSQMSNGEAIALTVAKHFTARLRDNPQEEMWIVLLDVRNQYRGKKRIYVGCCDQLVAKTGEILSRVVERNLPRYALVHNHPSGNGNPSGADISFTERLVRAGQFLDIELVDHIVLGQDLRSYVSMRQSKLIDFVGNPRVNRKIMDDGRVAESNLAALPTQT